MDEREYVYQAGRAVRLKLVHVEEIEAEITLSDDELSEYPDLVSALQECRVRSSVKKYPAEFEMLNPRPTVIQLDAQSAYRFVKLLGERRGRSVYEDAVRVETSYGKFIIAVEHQCG